VLARMSGSGATCFGLFGTPDEALAAEKALSVAQPKWWVKATTFCG
jgi:4-diphosphocytidyl-2-C-methyl-D-erythritol kinase